MCFCLNKRPRGEQACSIRDEDVWTNQKKTSQRISQMIYRCKASIFFGNRDGRLRKDVSPMAALWHDSQPVGVNSAFVSHFVPGICCEHRRRIKNRQRGGKRKYIKAHSHVQNISHLFIYFWFFFWSTLRDPSFYGRDSLCLFVVVFPPFLSSVSPHSLWGLLPLLMSLQGGCRAGGGGTRVEGGGLITCCHTSDFLQSSLLCFL